jgi:catechol 2,3-dioxygenase-like lactoylglutathione lyase family enzyme
VKILFVASVAVIAPAPKESRRLFLDTLGLPLMPHPGDDYYFSEAIEGTKHFGVWPLSQAAEACFGTSEWPSARPVPQACIEFEVADEASVQAAADELQAAGHQLLHAVKREPWGQTIARIQTADGVVVGISYAPWLHANREASPGHEG